jgi:flavin-dependent dehydrogenase
VPSSFGRESTVDVLIVGSGPAGTSAAWFLARQGVDVLLVDRAHFPRDKPCAEYLSPQASRILQAMGALNLVERAGAAQLGGMMVRAPNGEHIHGDFVARHGFRGFRDRGLAIRRRVLDAILVDRVRSLGARIAEGVRVTDLMRDAHGRVVGVQGLDESGQALSVRARLVVGADGLRSIVARKMGVARRLRWPRRIALVTHYRGVHGMRDRGEMHVHRDGYVGLADVGGGSTNVAIVIPQSRARDIGTDRAAYLDHWVRQRPQLAERFAGAERESSVQSTGPFASRVIRGWAPGAALVGDAADFFDPFTGEGIYAALRGGEMLAPFLMRALSTDDHRVADRSLADYEASRQAEFSAKWAVERLIGSAVGWSPLINRAARVLSRRKDMADLLVGVAGDFVPAREVLRPGYLLRFLFASAPRA